MPGPDFRLLWALRLNAAQVTPVRAWALLETLGPDGLASASASDWKAAADPKDEKDERRLWQPEFAASQRAESLAFDPERELRAAEKLGARALLRGGEGYPQLLEELYDPPVVLYARGPLDAPGPVAFVGSRGPTPYGRRIARTLAGEAAKAGLCVVSGLAYGLDAECHAAALDAGGLTWAVVAGGLGKLYPEDHRKLADRAVDRGGAVVAELALDADPTRPLFLRRNRIVAGLSWATVVIEGRDRSGTLNTAGHAKDLGRDVLAVPGPADSPLSEAPHKLIREGAGLVRGLPDIVAALPPAVKLHVLERTEGPAPAAAEPEERRILALIGSDALSLDELCRVSGLDIQRLSSIMFGLEAKKLISAVPGQRYAQKAR